MSSQNNLAAALASNAWRCAPDTHARYITGGAWQAYPYLRRVSDEILNAINRGAGIIVVNLPPRHGKSEFISYHVPLWFLDLWPDRRVILATHTASLSRKFGRRVRNSLLEQDLPTMTEVSDDSQAAEEWETKHGGGMVSVGVGGSLTGKGGHLLIVDDPVKNWEEADSEVFQERNIDWFKTTLWTRREPGAVVVILMTRWHKKDLAGFLLSLKGSNSELKTNVVHLCFPATALADDPLGRQPGEALCRERYDEDALKEIRIVEGSRHYAGLYQQQPVDEGNAIFNRQWFRYCDEAPRVFRSIITIDQAFSEKKTADYTVLLHSLIDPQNNLYVWEYVRRRVAIPGFIELLFAMAQRSVGLEKVVVEIAVNENPNNSAICLLIRQAMVDRDVYFNLVPVPARKDKITRATKAVHMMSQGKIFFRNNMTELEDELLSFPTGDHDDIVDTLSNAAIHMGVGAAANSGDARPVGHAVHEYDPLEAI